MPKCHICGGIGICWAPTADNKHNTKPCPECTTAPHTPTLAEIEAKAGEMEGWSSGCSEYSLNLHHTVKGENTPEITFMGRNNDANRRRAWGLLMLEE